MLQGARCNLRTVLPGAGVAVSGGQHVWPPSGAAGGAGGHAGMRARALRAAAGVQRACGCVHAGRDCLMGVRAITSVAPSESALGGLLRDLDRLWLPPRALPTPAERASAVVDSIDFSLDTVVLWMPGTSEHGIAEDVAETFRRRSVRGAVAVPYQATWRMKESVPDGEATLRAVLDLVRARLRPGQKLVLLGQSQGAWVISSVLRDPAYAALVHRTGLVAHPALAPAHGHDTTAGSEKLGPTVREFNDPDDLVTRDLGQSAPAALDIVDAFARLEMGKAVGGALRMAFRDPALLQALVASQLFRVKGTANPHESGSLLDQAIEWTLGVPRRRRAT